MGNSAKKNQAIPVQGAVYAPYGNQPVVQQVPMVVQQPAVLQPVAPVQAAAYQPGLVGPQQPSYRPAFPSAPFMPRYQVSPSLPLASANNPASYFENDAFLSNLTGWSTQDIERLRHEFQAYANTYGVIDREGFRKLYIASLLNMTWEGLERDAEAAFRNFDINQTGVLDFNEYITACSRMARETSAGAPAGQPYVY